MKEFFGFGGYLREPEGFLSFEHIIFVTFLMVVMVLLAVFIGKRFKGKSEKEKNIPLIYAALLIDGLEIFKIILMCIRGKDPMGWLTELPLFLCSIQLITIPLSAFAKGRVKESAMDFVAIFGILGALLGTYGAGNNYGTYPVLCFDNVVSGITHSISGFASLYIMISGLLTLKKKNIIITFSILFGFCIAAYVTNILIDYNYMFLMRGDGTPYEILYSLVQGHKVFYPLTVVGLFVLYILCFYGVHRLIKKKAD